jgi:hypothetical protein
MRRIPSITQSSFVAGHEPAGMNTSLPRRGSIAGTI